MDKELRARTPGLVLVPPQATSIFVKVDLKKVRQIMAEQNHLEILEQGMKAWNEWRKANPEVIPDLSYADLRGIDLRPGDSYKDNGPEFIEEILQGFNLSNANLQSAVISRSILVCVNFKGANLLDAKLNESLVLGANFTGANLSNMCAHDANLSGAIFVDALMKSICLPNANLTQAHLVRSNLTSANLYGVNLTQANLSEANLCGAFLQRAILIKTNLSQADLSEADIYGISVWDLKLDGAKQLDLRITETVHEPKITVDNLEVAQFIHLLIHNEKVREVLDTITSKVVLILGRFTLERKEVLDAIRDELRLYNYLPVLFDFDKPISRDTLETVSTLAHLARFIIADLTNAKSVLQELQRIVPDLPSVPVQPLILASDYEPGMIDHLKNFPWFLDTYRYNAVETLLSSLRENVIQPAESKARELQKQQ